ncbi:hypothetical protein C0584_05770 [Candidatus Parcubacteria bacterium]|nr:MAG: hypothetical protein C0584_05770 [Candidatus Parcubacteria bacterium]
MKTPLKTNWKTEGISIIIIVSSLLLAIFFYNNFPDSVPTHWNMEGEADSWSSSELGAFLMPGIMVLLYFIFHILPLIDPKKKRYEEFGKTYNIFRNIILMFMFLIYIATSLIALGYDVNINSVILTLIGVLFLIIGNYMSKIKMNWFFGIRTPWTLSSEKVWNKTHRLAGKLFFLSGFLFFTISYLPSPFNIGVFLFIVTSLSLGLMAYSYYIYNKENKNDN